MHPVIVKIGELAIHSYGLMLALSFVAGIIISSRRAKRMGLDPNVVSDVGFWVILSAIIGSRFYYVLLHFEEFKDDLVSIFNPFHGDSVGIGGLVMYGGLIGAIIAGYIFFKIRKQNLVEIDEIKNKAAHEAGLKPGDQILRINGYTVKNGTELQHRVDAVESDRDIVIDIKRDGAFHAITVKNEQNASHTESENSDHVFIKKLGFSVKTRIENLPFLPYADAIAPVVGFGIFLTRIGCFLNGCCYGKPTHAWHGVHFPIDSPAGYYQSTMHASKLIASQLFLSAGGLAIGIIVLLVGRKKIFTGFQFYLTIVLYALLRFAVDFTRFYEEGEKIASLSHNQIACVTLFVIFGGLILKNILFKQDENIVKTKQLHEEAC